MGLGLIPSRPWTAEANEHVANLPRSGARAGCRRHRHRDHLRGVITEATKIRPRSHGRGPEGDAMKATARTGCRPRSTASGAKRLKPSAGSTAFCAGLGSDLVRIRANALLDDLEDPLAQEVPTCLGVNRLQHVCGHPACSGNKRETMGPAGRRDTSGHENEAGPHRRGSGRPDPTIFGSKRGNSGATRSSLRRRVAAHACGSTHV